MARVTNGRVMNLREYARLGAQQRVRELQEEIDEIARHFKFGDSNGNAVRTEQKKRTISAAARKKMSAAAKARWAIRKAAETKTAASSGRSVRS